MILCCSGSWRIIVCLVILVCVGKIPGEKIFYTENDHIEMLETDTLPDRVLNSDHICLVEFYANWCGYSQGFIPHYKTIANETRLWHKNIVHIMAIDCALAKNNDMCWKNLIIEYPTFKFYRAFGDTVNGHKELNENARADAFMRVLIRFIEEQENRPDTWPVLGSYVSTLEKMFENYEKMKYQILIFEKDGSYVGRKIILDLSNYKDLLIIRRVTPTNNLEIFKQFDVDTLSEEPNLYVIENIEEGNKFEKLESFMSRLSTEKEFNQIDDSILSQPHGVEQESRYTYLKIIMLFIRYHDLVLSEESIDL